MNTELFTGKAQAYANARPGYPNAAMEYIKSLVPPNAVFADIGAGTGKFTALLARYGYEIFAIEPNDDMRGQLAVTLTPFPNVKIVNGTAETTTIPDHSVDVITCAQALHWFDPDVFRAECRRIGRPGALMIAIYNNTPGGSSVTHSKQSTELFFKNPTVREFPNPMFYTRESWLQYMTSHSHDPLPSDPGYDAHIAEMDAVFDRENTDGLLRRDVVTVVYYERIGSQITIRLAVPADAPDMAEVHMRSWEVAYKDIIPAEYIQKQSAKRPAMWQRILANENSTQYVIQIGGKTAGIMCVVPKSQDDDADDNVCELEGIYLHPDYYRQGIGTQAMEFAYDIARCWGKTQMTLWVFAENINTIKFYEKCGFTPDGKTKTYDMGKIMNCIRMIREI